MSRRLRLLVRDGSLRAVRIARRVAEQLAALGKPARVDLPAGWQEHSAAIAGKVVLITGSTRGIGRAAAQLFAERGAKVALHGRSAARAQELAAVLRAAGSEARGYGVDLAQVGGAAALVDAVIGDFGALDVLINNGAVLPPHTLPAWESDTQEFAEVLATNVRGPFEASVAAIRWMRQQRRPGRIVNVSSDVADPAQEPRAGLAAYGISKIALEGMSRYLARETQQLGITVTTLRAPTTNTDMIQTHVSWESRPLMPSPEAVAALYLWAATAPAEEVNRRLDARTP